MAGVPGAIASIPDGMASAVLVGVNPVYGLYASMAGPIAGGAAVSARLMVVTTTTSAALAAGSALSDFAGADRSEALFLLTATAGVIMVLAELLRLGRYTRFASVSVLTGFLTGVRRTSSSAGSGAGWAPRRAAAPHSSGPGMS